MRISFFLFTDHLTTLCHAQKHIASDGTMTRDFNFERNFSWSIQPFFCRESVKLQ